VARREKSDDNWMSKVTCPDHELILFIRQLQVMLRSGIQLVVALETLSDREEHPKFGDAVGRLAIFIAHGHQFSHALRKFPKVFDLVFISLVAVGEETGQLDACMERLADWRERDLRMKKRLISAMTYPALVLALTAFMTLFMFYYILPGFIEIFDQMGTELPATTRLLVTMTEMATNPFFWLLITVFGIGIGHALRRYWREDEGAKNLALIFMTIPVIGPLFVTASVARYAAAIATMLGSGMELTRSLALGARASGNPAIVYDNRRVIQEIRMGNTVSCALSTRPDIYSPNLLQMIAAGEESSDISEMFERSSEFHDEEAGYLIDAVGAAMEPVMLTIVATILGFVLISVFLPLYSHLDSL
jgi:type IV pilus assembly protein PilC